MRSAKENGPAESGAQPFPDPDRPDAQGSLFAEGGSAQEASDPGGAALPGSSTTGSNLGAATDTSQSGGDQAVTASVPDDVQEFHIPVSEHVRLWPTEVLIVDHPAFARLADVYQLGQAHLVYRGATLGPSTPRP